MIHFTKQIWWSLLVFAMSIITAEAVYKETMDPKGIQLNVQTDCGLSGKGEAIDSEKLQQAIDELAGKGGGVLIFPEGIYLLGRVRCRSNVHLVFDAKAVLKADLSRSQGKGINLFSLGLPGERITNVSLRSKGGRVRVELATSEKVIKASFVVCFGVENFLIEGFDIYDEQSDGACVSFGFDSDGNVSAMPVNGTVRNLTAYNCRYGYGLVQTSAARFVHFENLHGVGGCTLRLEVPHGPTDNMEYRGVWDITARNISCQDGHCAVILGPHFTKNGVVKIYDVRSESCAFAVKVGHGYVGSRHEGNPNLKPGSFAPGTWVKNIHAVYGVNAQLHTKDAVLLPEERLHLFQPKTEKGGLVGRGPSVSAVLNMGGYAKIENVTCEGFGNKVDPVITKENTVTQKPYRLFSGKNKKVNG
ncbi:hypothetical protein [Pontiella sulfatireligans]|uniref:Iota-carrageenase n=1 Tax=Pontiella sulfatireligans TaxID=2750658 RepID=A0A6C2UGR4_9BACT|nr:hypothetical protein [Pontiella sulfatireligans]VGO19318.1 Iota-carrageenase [Pontiella sulfatireligans]